MKNEFNITKDNWHNGQHTLLCTLSNWAEIGWFLPSKIMDKIKEYMPIVSSQCNMVSNYSKLSFQRDLSKHILDYMNDPNDYILMESIYQEDELVGEFYVYEIPNVEIRNKSYKCKYFIAINFKDIDLYIWRKI